MLAPDVELVDLDGRHLRNWLALATPPAMSGSDPSWSLVVVDRGRVVKVISAGTGSIDSDRISFGGTAAPALAGLKRELGADLLIVVERDAMARLWAEIDRNLTLDQDFTAQCLTIWRALKELSGRGIWLEPRLLDLAPPVSPEAAQKTFNLLIPDNSSMVAYIFEDDRPEVFASAIATKSGGDIDLFTTHLGLADAMSEAELARDWKAQHRRLLQLVAERFAEPCLGAFASRSSVDRIVRGPSDQLGREINSGHLILAPAPTWLLGLIGGATVAAAATRSARALARFLPASARKMAADLASTAQGALRDSAANPFSLLGFDPVELIRQLREYYKA